MTRPDVSLRAFLEVAEDLELQPYQRAFLYAFGTWIIDGEGLAHRVVDGSSRHVLTACGRRGINAFRAPLDAPVCEACRRAIGTRIGTRRRRVRLF